MSALPSPEADAAVVATDAAFSCLTEDGIALVSGVELYQPGRLYLRELPPLRTALDGLAGVPLLVVDGYAELDLDRRGYRWFVGTSGTREPPAPVAAGCPRLTWRSS